MAATHREVVALHHAEGLEMSRRKQDEGQSATYAANQRISILAIKQALSTADLSGAWVGLRPEELK